MFVLNVGNRRTAPRVFLNISVVFTSSFISQFISHLSLQRPLPLTPFSPYPSCSRAFSSSHSICVTFICSPLSAGTKNLITHCQPVRRGGGGRILPLFLSAPLFFNALCGGEDRRGKIYGWWDRWGMNNGQKGVQGYLVGRRRARGGEIDVTRDTLSSQFPPQPSYLSCVGSPGRALSTCVERGPGQISRGESWPLALFLIQPQFYLLMLLQWG